MLFYFTFCNLNLAVRHAAMSMYVFTDTDSESTCEFLILYFSVALEVS